MYLFLRFYFFRVSGSQQNWEEGTEISHIPPAPRMHNLPHQNGTLATMDEHTVTYHNHQSPLFTLGFTLGVLHSMGLDKCIHHYSIIQSIFTALKILCALPIHLPLSPKPLATTDLFTLSIVLPFPECHTVCGLSHWRLLLSHMHLRFLHVFSWLDSSFLFSVE